MTAREHAYVTERLGAGQRAGLRLLDLLRVGLDPGDAVHAVAPGLDPVAAVAAEKLAGLAFLYGPCLLAAVLAGLVSAEVLEETVAHIPAVPAAWREQYLRAS